MGKPVTKLEPDTTWQHFRNEVNYPHVSGMQPAVLSPLAFSKQMEEFTSDQGYPSDQEAWDDGTIMVLQALEMMCGGFKPWSLQQAFDGDEFTQPLNLATSGGFGISNFGGDKLSALLDPIGGPKIKKELKLDRQALKGKGPLRAYPMKYSLKDEKRKLQKILDKMTRVFAANNLIMTINGRRVLGDFCGKFMNAAANGFIEPACGRVLDRGGWHRLLSHLFWEFDVKFGFDKDVKMWDKKYAEYIHRAVNLVIAHLAGSEELAAQVIRVGWRLMCCPGVCHIFGSLFVRPKDMPSGDMATIIRNCIAMFLVYAYMFCKHVPKNLRTIQDFRHNLRCCFLGDDNCLIPRADFYYFGKTPQEIELTMKNTFLELGPWELTSPRDDGSPATPLTLEFAGYVSVYVEEANMLIPRLSYEKILAIMEWYTKIPRSEPPRVVHLSRYNAAFQKCFPLLWSDDEKERKLVTMIYFKRRALIQIMIASPIIEENSAARGSPSLFAISQLYFGKYVKVQHRLFGTDWFRGMERTVVLAGQEPDPGLMK